MCYYYGRKVTRDEYNRFKEEEKKVAFLNKDFAIFKGFDYNELPVLRLNPATGEKERVEIEWGYLPSYIRTKEEATRFRNGYKSEKTGKWVKGYTTLNFVSEQVQERMFKESLDTRCLVEFDMFYEWMHVQLVGKSGKLLKTPEKFPYLIELNEPGPYYFAGLYSKFTNTFTFATTEANSLMKIIHNSKERMPTILPGDLHKDWLSPNLSVDDIMDLCNYQTATAQMKA
ncbi:MAG TPA: SOS response-associated peptidase family protein, partial [Mucilaginibacter sp.]|nr:SOS response-associated peptidase family protein [Mucilaginibacter sp.]